MCESLATTMNLLSSDDGNGFQGTYACAIVFFELISFVISRAIVEEFDKMAHVGMEATSSVSELHSAHNRYTNIHAYDHR